MVNKKAKTGGNVKLGFNPRSRLSPKHKERHLETLPWIDQQNGVTGRSAMLPGSGVRHKDFV